MNGNSDGSSMTIDAEEGKRLVLAIEDAGVDILHRCGGRARCTTCRCDIIEGNAGEMREVERERLAREDELAPSVRLSCQILTEHDLKLKVIYKLSESDLSDAGPRPSDDMEP
ncbi:MAG: 2Fe-2S iron-sulfur cluster-binding protein [Thermomicrobiales bacterium]